MDAGHDNLIRAQNTRGYATWTVQDEIKGFLSTADYPWGVMLTTMLLFRTTGHVVRKVYPGVFTKWPTALALQVATVDQLAAEIKRCGFQNNKASCIKVMTDLFLKGHKYDTIPFMGVYGCQAYRIFVLNDFSFVPQDPTLRKVYDERRTRS